MLSDTFLDQTQRTTVNRTSQRASYDCQLIKEIIQTCVIGHLSFNHDGIIHSIPLPFWHLDDYLYCHFSVNSRLANLIKQEVCISFAIIDALVLAKSAFKHSFNYRSVVVYGQFEQVSDDHEKIAAMQQFMALFDEKRWDQVRAPNKKELNATSILKLSLKEAVAKVRSGPPNDKPADLNLDVWAGIIPKTYAYGAPEAI